jgi:uncharacterized membrane protein
MDRAMGNLLRAGALLSGAVVLAGALVFLAQSGTAPAVYSGRLATRPALAALDSRAVIQLGLVLLIATPIARVLLAFVAFTLSRDRVYMLISGIVLAVLATSLAGGLAGG